VIRRLLAYEPVRYLAKGGAGMVVGLALLTVWVDGVGIAPELAILINWVLIGIVGTVVLDRWVFEGDPATTLRGFGERLAGAQSAQLVGKGANYIIFVGLLRVTDRYRLAWVAGALATAALTYALNRLWFRSAAQRTRARHQ